MLPDVLLKTGMRNVSTVRELTDNIKNHNPAKTAKGQLLQCMLNKNTIKQHTNIKINILSNNFSPSIIVFLQTL